MGIEASGVDYSKQASRAEGAGDTADNGWPQMAFEGFGFSYSDLIDGVMFGREHVRGDSRGQDFT